MKRTWIVFMLACAMALGGASSAYSAPTKQQKKVAYTLKNLKLDAAKTKALQPVLMEYLNEMKTAQKPYDDLKEKYKTSIKNGTLTDKAATALLAAKWTAAKNEVAVKEKFEKKFAALIPAKKVWYCFDLLNDKMSKIEGKADSKAGDDEDDE